MWKFAALGLSLLFSASAHSQNTGTSSEGLAAWDSLYQVLSHPRCSNCHVGDDNRPRWSGAHYGLAEGEWAYHGMNINAGEDRIGATTIPCATCHQTENSSVLHGPPGADSWSLPPVEMEWFGKSSSAICGQIKDPARNGGRSISEIADHVDDDNLVHWGWDPGPGREPAPFGRKETVALFGDWAAAGAPCPAAIDEAIVDYLDTSSTGD